ncbi:response regulator [Candidatus Margulisiibacteriota bacterium]
MTVSRVRPPVVKQPNAVQGQTQRLRANRGRVLVVDNEAQVRSVFDSRLRKEGYEVQLASSGAEAIALIAQERRAGRVFDIVITDLSMEQTAGARYAGFEVLREAKNTRPETVVVVITGFADKESALEALHGRADLLLEKPFSKFEETVMGPINSLREAQVERIETARERDSRVAHLLLDTLSQLAGPQYTHVEALKDGIPRLGAGVEAGLHGQMQENANKGFELGARMVEIIRTAQALVGPAIALGKMEEVNLRDVLDEVLGGLGERKMNVRLEGAENLPRVEIEVQKIRAAFGFFINSALDAAAIGDNPIVTIRAERDGDSAVIKIIDEGKRERKLTLKDLTEFPFTQLEIKTYMRERLLRLSLGLQNFVLHEWGVEIEGDETTGATVAISMPFMKASKLEKSAALEEREEGVGRKIERVLAVDDEPMILSMLLRMLPGSGLEREKIGTAGTGVKALALLQAERFDLLLTDVFMEGMDGIELARRARQIDPDLLVVLMTGNSAFIPPEDIAIDGLILKPFTPKLLKAMLDGLRSSEA